MATWATDNESRQSENRIAHSAAQFLGARFQGPHKDKRIARELGVSPGMAKLLRAGRGWTLARLDQAVRLYGTSFSDAVLGHLRPGENVETQLDAISAQLHEVLSIMRARIDIKSQYESDSNKP